MSDYSDQVEILAAQIPDQPTGLTTTIDNDNVLISWSIPDDRGSPLLGYTIYIRQSDSVSFAIDITDCDGSQQAILDSASCSVPISTLRASSYQLPWGSSVWAKVNAFNLYGTSFNSVQGNGAVILTAPDAPINV